MIVWILVKAVRYKSWFHLFDPKHNLNALLQKEGGEFGPHWTHYEGLAKLSITLSAGALAFLINIMVNQKPPFSVLAQKTAEVAPIVVGFFGTAIFLLIAFLLWMTYCYEEYCHSPNHDTYRAWKYCITQTLGIIGFLSFLLGFGWLGVNLFS